MASDESLEKITADDLRSFADAGKPRQRRSVLVEISEPPRPLRPRTGKVLPPRRAPEKGPRSAAIADLADVEGRKEEMETLERLLNDFDLPEAPVRLNAAQAFVVNVTGEQLKRLARRPEVGFIRPNRQRRAPPRG